MCMYLYSYINISIYRIFEAFRHGIRLVFEFRVMGCWVWKVYGYVSCLCFFVFLKYLSGSGASFFTSLQCISVVVDYPDSKFHVYSFKVSCSACGLEILQLQGSSGVNCFSAGTLHADYWRRGKFAWFECFAATEWPGGGKKGLQGKWVEHELRA